MNIIDGAGLITITDTIDNIVFVVFNGKIFVVIIDTGKSD